MVSHRIAIDYPERLIPELVICLRRRGFEAYQEAVGSRNIIVTNADRAALIVLSGCGWVVSNN